MRFLKQLLVACLVLLGVGAESPAVSITGSDWIVHYNLPDQNSSAGSASADEYCIRNALLDRINALQSNDQATLTVYSFSGDTAVAGAAGPIINAVNTALDRGARIRMAVDSYVDTGTIYGYTNSLDSLAARPTNPLVLVEDDSAWGIMHDKLGVFSFGPTSHWVFVTSWNFTGGASTYQWNIGVELQGPAVFAAYSNEMAELLAGRFHDHAAKSHAHDGSIFAVAGAWAPCAVRFAPSPDDSNGGDNPLTDITNLIAGAQEQIVFALNKLTRFQIASQLVAAVDRGVEVNGVMPRSDTETGGDSAAVYAFLTNTANYAGPDTVRMRTAYAKADYTALDSGESDLVHAKYMLIDPFGPQPVVIHGSANWTASALQYETDNDENILFLRHRAIATLFYAHFKRVTGALQGRNDFWCELERESGALDVNLWLTDTNRYSVDHALTPTSAWTSVLGGITGSVGRAVYPAGAAAGGFYRGRRE